MESNLDIKKTIPSKSAEDQIENRMQHIEATESDLVATVQQLQEANLKLQEQIKELVKVNASWEKYAHDLKTSHEKHLTSIMQDIKDEKAKTDEYKARDQQREAATDCLNRTNEQRLHEAEEERNKAVEHAVTQQKKVDELKVDLNKERQRCGEVQERLKATETKCVYLQKAVDNLRKQSDEGKSGQSRARGQARSCGNEECMRKIKDLETETSVLQQQIALFKEDFDNERRDREKAQAEILKLKESLKTTKGINHEAHNELLQRTVEVTALKETRDRQEITIERLQREYNDLKRKLDQTGRDKYNVHIYSGGPYEETRRQHSPSRGHYTGFLTDDQKQQIRRNWGVFCNNLRTDEIAAQLFSEGVLSLVQKQEIDARPTSSQKAEYVMSNIIMKATQRDLRAFKNALENSCQLPLAALVPSYQEARPQHVHIREEPMDIVVPRAQPVTWHCILCTYENYIHRTSCEMCGTEKPELRLGSHPIPRGVEQCDNGLTGDLEEDNN